MRVFALLLGCMAFAEAAELSEVHTVYIMPMSHGLDQYIANRLTSMHVFQVVTDPKLAQTVFTDRIGEGFEDRMQEMYPPPAPPPPPAAKEKDAKEKASKGEAGATPEFKAPEKSGRLSTFGRGRGTVFLVDAKSKQVLWSVYDPPKNSTSAQLDKTASRIVNRLKKDIAGK